MHIRIPPPEKPRPKPPPPSPPEYEGYHPMWDGRISIPIKIWVLLHRGPHATCEIHHDYRIKIKTIYYAISQLRDHGMQIERRARKYHLINQQAPLPVMNLTRRRCSRFHPVQRASRPLVVRQPDPPGPYPPAVVAVSALTRTKSDARPLGRALHAGYLVVCGLPDVE